MTAYMIPMRVCCNSCNRLFGNLFYRFSDIADSKPCVYQKSALAPYQKIAMRFFGMSVFAYNVCFIIDIFNRKPFFHFSPDNKAKISVAFWQRIFSLFIFQINSPVGSVGIFYPVFTDFSAFYFFKNPSFCNRALFYIIFSEKSATFEYILANSRFR